MAISGKGDEKSDTKAKAGCQGSEAAGATAQGWVNHKASRDP
jgi:hypothetical protein